MSGLASLVETRVAPYPSAALLESLRVLEMSGSELAEAIRCELASNPCLESAEGDEGFGDDAFFLEGPAAPGLSADEGVAAAGGRQEEAEHGWQPGETAARESLYEAVLNQLSLLRLTPTVRRVAEYIAGCLDRDGYLRVPLASIAAECSVSEATARLALEAVQSVDPPGVGARSLAECLELQLRALGAPEPHIAAILRELELGTGPNGECPSLQLAVRLSPSPGVQVGDSEPVPCALPDLVVVRVGEELVCEVPYWPEHVVRVSPWYVAMYRDSDDPEVRRFLQGSLKRAHRIVSAVERRRVTLLRLGEFLVRRLRRAFLDGLDCLEPLSLSEAGRALGLHVSTVSRAVKNKYIWSPRTGTVPLRRFFTVAGTSSSARACGPGESARQPWRERVLSLVADLARAQPGLTDSQLAQMLSSSGFAISRRTVAKYRHILGIPSAARRRQTGMR